MRWVWNASLGVEYGEGKVKNLILIVLTIENVLVMFWGEFRQGKVRPGLFFDLDDGKRVNSTIYRNQILTGPLQEFREESFGDVEEAILWRTMHLTKNVYSCQTGAWNEVSPAPSKFPRS